jgi:hypothetical protein
MAGVENRGAERVEPGHHEVRWWVFGLRDDRDLAVIVALQSKRIAVLGLAFKLGTDDVRNSRSIPSSTSYKPGCDRCGLRPRCNRKHARAYPQYRIRRVRYGGT